MALADTEALVYIVRGASGDCFSVTCTLGDSLQRGSFERRWKYSKACGHKIDVSARESAKMALSVRTLYAHVYCVCPARKRSCPVNSEPLPCFPVEVTLSQAKYTGRNAKDWSYETGFVVLESCRPSERTELSTVFKHLEMAF